MTMTQDLITAESVEEDGRDTKTVVLAAVLVAVVLGAGAFFFLGGSSTEDELTNAAAPSVTRTVSQTGRAPLAPPAATPTVMPAPATVVGGQNPFKVLYTAPVQSSGSGTTSTSPGATSSGTTSSGTTSSGATSSGTTGSGSTGSSSGSTSSGGSTIGSQPGTGGVTLPAPPAAPVPTEPYVLELVSITPVSPDTLRTTSWVVDSTPVNTIFVGQRFGVHGELVVLALGTDDQGETVLLQVGDAAPRSIHVGEKGSVL